jgi:tetratricopeptide (TPR) repeat protein
LCKESKVSTDVLKAHAHLTRAHFENEAVRYLNKEHRDCHQVFKTSTYEQFKNINPDRVEQTCQWALSHPLYQRWKDSATDDLLWVSADPGCGKSVLSKALVDEELRSGANDSTVCYFFFKDNDEQNSLATGLCALLHQLFQHQPHLLRHATSDWKKDGIKLQQETDELWRILLAATSDVAACNMTCVLDALDECRDVHRSSLIAKLARFHEDAASRGLCQSWLKFIVTSRPYDDIQRGFEQIPPSLPAIRLRGEQEDDEIHAEINRVIKVRVSQLAKELGLRKSTSSRLEQNLLAMEHRTYLWLHLAIDDIRMTLRDSSRPDEAIIKSVPSSVEGAYEKILARVTKAQHQKVKLILQIIVGARRPLALSEMALALGLATSKQHKTSVDAKLDPVHLGKQLRHWCGLFVFVNQSKIYLIHQTAREFLVARHDYEHSTSFAHSTWRHCVQQTEVEQTMTVICIRCLNLEDREALSSDESPADDQFPSDVSEAGESMKDFTEYCCEWWMVHYRLSQDASGQDTFQDVLALYDTEGEAFKFWFGKFWAKTRQHDSAKSMKSIRLAALSNHDRVLDHLLSKTGMNTEAEDEDGRTALYWASDQGHDKIVQMLLEKGADVNAEGGFYGYALQAASAKGYEKIVQMLLDKNADVNAQGGGFGSALQAVSATGHYNIVQMLLDRGADVNAHGGEYGNALQAAIVGGNEEIILSLLDAGADVSAQGGKYGSALYAALYGDYDKAMQTLLDRGASVNAQGGEYNNALQSASCGSHDKIVQMLSDSAEAEAMLEQALARSEKALGSEHPFAFMTGNRLGNLYADQGRFAEAEAMYERALAGYKKVLGPDHTSTLNTVNTLGLLYTDQDRLAEAGVICKRALAGKEKALGAGSTSILRTANNLGNLYSAQGKLAEAEAMYERARAGDGKALRPKHTATLRVVNIPGNIYKAGVLSDDQYTHEASMEDIEQGLTYIRDELVATPMDHPGPEHKSSDEALGTASNCGQGFNARVLPDRNVSVEALLHNAIRLGLPRRVRCLIPMVPSTAVIYEGVDALFAAYFYVVLEVVKFFCTFTSLPPSSPPSWQAVIQQIEVCNLVEVSYQQSICWENAGSDKIHQQDLGAMKIPTGQHSVSLHQWEYPETIRTWRVSLSPLLTKENVEQENQSADLTVKMLNTVTISGYGTSFEAMSCEEYVSKRWGSIGVKVATFLTTAANL